MTATGTPTTNLHLPIYQAGDKVSYLGDWNNAMDILDTQVELATTNVASLTNDVNTAKTTAISANAAAEQAETDSALALSTATQASGTATTAQATANTAIANAANAETTASGAATAAAAAQNSSGVAVTTANNAQSAVDAATAAANAATTAAGTASGKADNVETQITGVLAQIAPHGVKCVPSAGDFTPAAGATFLGMGPVSNADPEHDTGGYGSVATGPNWDCITIQQAGMYAVTFKYSSNAVNPGICNLDVRINDDPNTVYRSGGLANQSDDCLSFVRYFAAGDKLAPRVNIAAGAGMMLAANTYLSAWRVS